MRTRTVMCLLGYSLLLGCSNDDGDATSDYKASIRYTDHNVPHITAKDYKGLGYGIGYAQAAENLCTLSEQILKLKGEKSKYLGVGDQQTHLLTDLGYKGLDYLSQAETLYSGLEETTKDIIQGYVAGFNRSLAERASPTDYPSPCRDAEWVLPITEHELLAYHLDLAGLASARNFLKAMPAAQPPQAVAASSKNQTHKDVPSLQLSVQLDAQETFTSEGIGSNGWALGQDKVESGTSALLANPHFPWDGELRFYEQHLTIPGELDVTGVGMIGLPAVVIGFNEHVGWTHTVSQSKRFTLYQLELDPTNPLRYRYGTEYRDMTTKTVSVDVKQADGSVQTMPYTLYFSHYGPIINLSSLSPALGWNTETAITYRDANADNTRMLAQWMAMGKAKSRDEFFEAFNTHQGIPWVNTLMIDKDGGASYLDGTQVPQLSPQAEAYWAAASQFPQLAPIWQDGAGSVILPGNEAIYEWVDTGDAGAPGLVPFKNAPQMTTNDYAFNANSSHWLTNLTTPLEGYSMMYGPEHTIRSTRTRYNAQLITGNDISGDDGKFSTEELKAVFTHNGSLFGQNFRNALVARCTQYPTVNLAGAPYDLSTACNALRNWDGTYNLDSRGAHLMREFLANFRVSSHRSLSDNLFEASFDPANAATTPSGLVAIETNQAEEDPILQALAKAASLLTDAGIALDAPLRDVQYTLKAEGLNPIPVSGGYSYEGLFNMSETKVPSRSTSDLANALTGAFVDGNSPLVALDENGDGSDEYAYRINYGASIVMALRFDEEGPQAEMFLSYGQSHDPESEYFIDQTQNYSELSWRPMIFDDSLIVEQTTRSLVITDK